MEFYVERVRMNITKHSLGYQAISVQHNLNLPWLLPVPFQLGTITRDAKEKMIGAKHWQMK